MVSECNVKTITWLHGTNEARAFPVFFPTTSSLIDEAEIKVKLLYETELGDIIKKTVLLVQEEVTFFEREHFLLCGKDHNLQKSLLNSVGGVGSVGSVGCGLVRGWRGSKFVVSSVGNMGP